MPSKISFKALADGVGEIMIYDFIGNAGGGFVGITAKEFAEALKAIAPATTLHMRINSPGGTTPDAAAMKTALGRFKLAGGRVVAFIDGVAASAASWLAMSADEIVIAPDALVMIHRASSTGDGGAHALRSRAEALDKVDATMAEDYAARSGQPLDQVNLWMSGETWFTADEAVAAGFADRVEGEPMRLAAFAEMDQFHYKHVPISIAKMAVDYWAKRSPPTRPAKSAADIWSKWNSPTALKRGAK